MSALDTPVRKAVLGMMAMKRMSMAMHHMTVEEAARIGNEVRQYKKESEQEEVDGDQDVQRLKSDGPEGDRESREELKKVDDASTPTSAFAEVTMGGTGAPVRK
jgi:calcium/calmodulin-dependent protein kinase I